MTHRFLVNADQISADSVAFSDDQAHQIRNVLRLRQGDQVLVFDGATPRDLVVELSAAARHGRLIGEQPQAAEPKTRLVAYPALLQRDKFESVLQKLTEIGVAAVVPVITARGLVREPPDERRQERWRAILREATEQSGRGVVPALRPAEAFSAAIAAVEGRVVLASPDGEGCASLRDALGGKPAVVSLFVGPEGGFTREEVQAAVAAGGCVITLGPRVLRTETASPVLAALVLYELGDFF